MAIICVIVIVVLVIIIFRCCSKNNVYESVAQHNDSSGKNANVDVFASTTKTVQQSIGNDNGEMVSKRFSQKAENAGVVKERDKFGTSKPIIEANIVKSKDEAHFKKEIPYRVKQIPLLKTGLNLLDIDYSQKYVVKYDMVSSKKLEYPYLKAPEKGTWIKLPVKGRSGRRGFCEEKLAHIINEYHLLGFMDNLTLFADGCPYEPDFAYIDVEKGIFVDIEIDEPYSGWEKTPIHYKIVNGTIDQKRNERFTERGWIVLRFSEKQVFEQPKSCLKYLYQQLCRIDSSVIIPASVASAPDLKADSMWTMNDAYWRIQNKTRENMLGISEFVMPSETPVTMRIVDYADGKIIEDAIETFRDDKAWRKCSDKGLWNKYIDERPNGKHVLEAKEKNDEILWGKCVKEMDYDRYLRTSELQRHSIEARKLKEENDRIKAENVRKEMERIKAIQEEAKRKEEEAILARKRREEEERKKREAENYARQQVSCQTQTKAPSSRGYA